MPARRRRAIGMGKLPERCVRNVRPGVRVVTAGAPPAAATIERNRGRPGWEITHVYGLTETAPFIHYLRAATRT